ncbi:lipopolysaccharide kinase InaA family protein [Kiritimatiellota bacterium B12222]|nr:lipopolysaccharide kinase InaA family protein [Kiritimatiellota bacterium B12222]
MRAWLAKLPDVPECDAFSPKCDHVRCVRPPGNLPHLALKRYDPPPTWKAVVDESTHRGSRAHRAFQHACRLVDKGVPTPSPVAWLERKEGQRILEQFLVTECLPQALTLREALLHHYYEKPLCSEIIDLLEVSAQAVRRMHDAGFEHNDLGNQNLMVQRDAQGNWSQAWIIDLHRGRFHDALSDALKGKDNARITLPSDLRRIFFEMQFAPQLIPDAFRKSEKRTRSQYRLQKKSRKLRHPFRPELSVERRYPSEKDIWIWDDRSRQAIPALKSRDKRKYYRKRDALEIGKLYLAYRSKIQKAYAEIKTEAWTQPVSMKNRIGLSCNLEPDRFDKERRWLNSLGPLPLLVRLYHHETEFNQRFAIDAIRKLTAEGHQVTVALVQDRRAVMIPSAWQSFVEKAGGSLSGFIEGFEVGHAINRVKWGIWNIPEYRQLIEPFQNWKQRFPQVPLMGPAGIDFEYPRVLPFLDQWPENSLSAFSHHLYVDRRGDPENRQSGYDTVDKLALARAMARVHPACQERLIVSEVNWPLSGTDVWSPVGSPYQSPGVRHNDPSVDEDTYALYLKKYLLLSLCSGMADQVYWWNIAAHGFGLIDDRDPVSWRPRPAFHAFKELVDATRDATFVKREGEEKAWEYTFANTQGEFRL